MQTPEKRNATHKAHQKRRISDWCQTSSHIGNHKDEEYHDNPAFESVYEEDGDYLHSLSPAKGNSKISDSLYKNLQLMIMGEISPDDVINESVSYAETILNE